MKNLFLWYIPQVSLFVFGTWVAFSRPEMTMLAAVITGVMLAAAYTGGVNLIISMAARFRRFQQSMGRDAEKRRIAHSLEPADRRLPGK